MRSVDELSGTDIFKKQFYVLSPGNALFSSNEFYLSLIKFLNKEYPEIFQNVVKQPRIIREIRDLVIDYASDKLDLKVEPHQIRIKFTDLAENTGGVTLFYGKTLSTVEVDVSTFRDVERMKTLHNIVDIKGDKIVLKALLNKEAIVLLNKNLSIYDLLTVLPHELFHAIQSLTIPYVSVNLQYVEMFSTKEFFAEVLTLMFNKDVFDFFFSRESLEHLEYLMYYRFVHLFRKKVENILSTLIERGVIIDTEIDEILKLGRISFMNRVYNAIKNIDVFGSMTRFKPLYSVSPTDYGLVFLLMNYNVMNDILLVKNNIIDSGFSRTRVIDPISLNEATIEDTYTRFKHGIIDELFVYDREKDAVLVKRPIEAVVFRELGKRVLWYDIGGD